MTPAPARAASSPAPFFRDGLGERVLVHDSSIDETLEVFRLRPELAAVPSFEFALRERTGRLANFRHSCYGRVRRVDRLPEPGGGLTIVSDHTPGARLVDILQVAEQHRLEIDISAALCLVRQLVPAVAMLHHNARDVGHGAIGPEWIVVTPHARLIVVEYVLGSAIEQLHLTRDRLWRDLRIAVPPAAGTARCDHRTDVTQIGLVALSLILGRRLRADEYPHRLPDLLASASERSALGAREPLSPALRTWLSRALQLDLRHAFQSAIDALSALDDLLAEENGYVAAPVALESFLAQYQAKRESAAGLTDWIAPAQPPATPPPAPEVVPLAGDTHLPAPGTPHGASRSVSQWTDGVRPAAPQHARPSGLQAPMPPPDRQSPPPVAQSRSNAWGASGSRELERPASPLRDVRAPLDRPAPAPSGRAMEHVGGPPVASQEDDDDSGGVQDAAEEHEAQPAGPITGRTRSRLRRIGVIVLALVALAEGVFIALRVAPTPVALPGRSGTLTVESRPTGAQVVIDGRSRGVTPTTLSLAPGAHIIELRGAGEPRVIPVTITAGTQVSQYIELQESPLDGRLQVHSEPPAALVVLLTPPDVPAPASGWISVSAPVEMQLFEAGRSIGTSQSDRIALPAGRHEIEIVSEVLAYRSSRVVEIVPGKVAAVRLDMPKGTLDLNAEPWAEVWIDGEKIGETPLGNLSVPIGPHEIVFRHPEYGEVRHAVTVTLGTPARLSVDLRK